MSLFRKNGSGSGENVNPFYLAIAAVIMPFIEAAKWCNENVYSGWKGIFTGFFGLIASISGGIAAANYAGNAWELGTFASSLVGIGAWVVIMFYAWPLLWRFVIKPAIDLCDAIYDRFRKYTLKYAASFFGGIVRVCSTICVGSKGAWDRVLSKEHEDTWFAELLGIVSHCSAFLGSGYLGYLTYGLVGSYVTWPIVGFCVSVFAALMVFGLLFGALEQFIKYGKLAFIALVLGGAGVYGAAPYLVAWTGLSGLLSYALFAGAFVVSVGYVFPLLNLMLTNGFWARVWKFLKPLPEKAYDGRNDKYAEFFHHLVNFITTAGVTGGSWYIATTAGVPVWGALPIAAVTAALTYIVGFKFVNWDGGNFIIGGLLSLAAGIKTALVYTAAGYIYGVYGGIVAGVLATLVVGVIVFPALYLSLKWFLELFGASKAADSLTGLYNKANEQFKKALKEIRHAWDNCYRDKSQYKDLILHLTNLAVTAGVVWGAWELAALVGAGTILTGIALVVVGGLGYLLIGKVLFKSGYGLEFLGAVLSLGLGIWVGNIVFGVDPSGLIKFAGIVAGIATWVATFFIAFPVVYVVAKFLTGWASGLSRLFGWFFEGAWKLFIGFWEGFVAMYDWLWERTAGIRRRLAAAWANVAEAYRKILRIIRGGR